MWLLGYNTSNHQWHKAERNDALCHPSEFALLAATFIVTTSIPNLMIALQMEKNSLDHP